ncbi:hypothetical protein [Georgenia sunbinii]
MTRRSLEDIKARADTFADAFESYDPKPGDQDAPLGRTGTALAVLAVMD